MQNQQINSLSDLDNAIAELEITQTEHLRLLKEQMSVAGNALQPMNLIKEVVLEATKSKNWKH